MAGVLERSYIEICGFERETVSRFRQITLNLAGVGVSSGGVKYADSAGGFSYEDSGKLLSVASNRFIHWSTSGDTVQFVEQSLDTNLLNNAVRLRIPHCLLLPGGVYIQETLNNVLILIVTSQSVHRLVLPHPSRMYHSDLVTELQMQSIFTDIGKLNLNEPAHSYVLPFAQGSHSTSPSTSAAWISHQGEALFALASPSGSIIIVTLPPHDQDGTVSILELKQSSMMQRLAGWMPTAIRGDPSTSDVAISLAVHQLEDDTFVFALCQDHKLRMWSFKHQMCLLVTDMLEYMPVGRGDVKVSPAQAHKLRLFFSSSIGLCLAVYLAVPKRSQFCVLQLVANENNRYSLDHISTLFSTQETVVDFVLTATDIWAVWLDNDNQTMVKYISFEHNTTGMWNQVFVQPSPEEEVQIGEDQDPREIYLDVLFSPLRFTASAIIKALQIYKRGTERYSDLSWEDLKKEVTVAVENELQSSVTEYEFCQEDYRLLQVEFWSKFYACCVQYQDVLSTPLALHVSPSTAMVCVLKKGFVSFLLPCFAVDHLYLSSDEYLISEEETPIAEDLDVSRDVLQLVQCLRLVNESLPEDLAYEMEKALDDLLSPEKVSEKILDGLLASEVNVIQDIENKLQDIFNPIVAMNTLLRELDLEADAETDTRPTGQSLRVRISLSQLYGSSVAASLICQAVCQTAMTRTLLCRDLLILQQLYLRNGDNVFLAGGNQLLQLQQDLIPRCSNLLCTYHLLKQMSLTLSSSVPLDILNADLQHLSVLELSDSTTPTSNRSVLNPQTVVELFYQNVARKAIMSQIFSQQDVEGNQNMLHWPQMISSVLTLLCQFLWPSNPSFLFPECLMGNCQYAQLQEYVRLVGSWCQVNVGSYRFVLGQCYLSSGEGQKALQCFQEAATEVDKEEFLMKLTCSDEETAVTAPRLLYYNKVLRLLEDICLPELVINLATLAISEAANDERSQAALWTRIFKHHLDLGHNFQAYEALTQNPDPSRQLDCLRQLVVVLCERAQLRDLIQFPFVNLHDEVVSIIESRARAVDLMTHNYYELLYAFHINRHNYRKAGTVMFEYGMRLGREVRTLRGLQKQVNCYLAALNCLRLVHPDYAWIVQPSSGAAYERPGASPKRNYDGEFAASPVNQQIDILELKDLEKEYVLARSRLTLAQQDPPSAAIAGGASSQEMVALLVQTGLFDTSLTLCQTFNLSLTPVFEGLTFKCIKLQYKGDQDQTEVWNWLAANQLPTIITTKESSATDEAWRLLAHYLEKYPSQNAQYHRCVINKLLSHGVPVPDWLINAYKEVDAAALLRLYLNYDHLECAAELVLEYVDALLGKGHQYFGIERPLSATASLVWLPYTSIDQLLRNLSESQINEKMYKNLKDKLSEYHRLVDQSSRHRLMAR
ncbi:nuclear pore complex protein Nup160 isoform X1 [Rhinichthys klamathensis goyatoka]|uniref:nuclear pore complex protein Nup160 isoform X1 n=1 Tax=Rhinichthys klamathensis goyatoka TaxID=3034132 RepID=UPI0024B5C916|nr:nuclear pore complex protein Nup160 isoform X1 [Rhinichthys klamathensis goyatoka]